MSPEEVSILHLLEERDRTTAAKLDAIAQRVDETRADLRGLIEQLAGVATIERFDALEKRVDALEDRDGERAAVERWRARTWAAAGVIVGLLISLAGVIVGLLG